MPRAIVNGDNNDDNIDFNDDNIDFSEESSTTTRPRPIGKGTKSTKASFDTAAGSPLATSVANIPSLKQKLAYLAAEERALSEQIHLEEATLLKQISEREDALKRLRSEHQQHQQPQQRDRRGTDPPAIPEFTTTSDHLRHRPPTQRLSTTGFPLDSLIGQAIHRTAEPSLNQVPVGHSSRPRSLAEVYREQEQRSSEIFLRPSQVTDVGQGKPLRVLDFVSRLRPQEEEQVVTTDSGAQTKLVLSIGNKKPQ